MNFVFVWTAGDAIAVAFLALGALLFGLMLLSAAYDSTKRLVKRKWASLFAGKDGTA